jgi:hypothetical protein
MCILRSQASLVYGPELMKLRAGRENGSKWFFRKLGGDIGEQAVEPMKGSAFGGELGVILGENTEDSVGEISGVHIVGMVLLEWETRLADGIYIALIALVLPLALIWILAVCSPRERRAEAP